MASKIAVQEKQAKSPGKKTDVKKEKPGAKQKQSTHGMTTQDSSSGDLDPFVTFASAAHEDKPEKYQNIDDVAATLRKIHSELIKPLANTVVDAFTIHDREIFLKDMKDNSEKLRETMAAIQDFLKISTRLADEYKQNHSALCIAELQERQDQELAQQAKNLGFGDAFTVKTTYTYNSSTRNPTVLDLAKTPKMKEYLEMKQTEQEKISKAFNKLKKDLRECSNNASETYKYAKSVQEAAKKQQKK